MEEIKVKAIVLKALDYKEKDKLLELFSLEKGKITVSLKGVRSLKAKLKFAGGPLNLIEYTLISRNGKYTVTGASIISSFFNIASNFLNYTVSCIVLEILNKTLRQEEVNAELFVLALKTFNALQIDNVNSHLILLKFYLEVLKILGFAIKFDSCLNCGKSFHDNYYFSFDNGSFVCSSCKQFYDVLVVKKDLQILQQVSEGSIENLNSLAINNDLISLLNILNKNLEMRCFINVKSFAQLNLL